MSLSKVSSGMGSSPHLGTRAPCSRCTRCRATWSHSAAASGLKTRSCGAPRSPAEPRPRRRRCRRDKLGTWCPRRPYLDDTQGVRNTQHTHTLMGGGGAINVAIKLSYKYITFQFVPCNKCCCHKSFQWSCYERTCSCHR